MKRKKPSRKDLISSCHEVGPDDGVDPRIFFRKAPGRKNNRKALQLCSEVARTLSHALAWELGDDLLSNLQVAAVVPTSDSSRLLVTVSLPAASAGPVATERVLERLRRSTGRLRGEVAAAIHRRRVPELTFRLEIQEGDQ